jgi:hypothetical protein
MVPLTIKLEAWDYLRWGMSVQYVAMTTSKLQRLWISIVGLARMICFSRRDKLVMCPLFFIQPLLIQL